LLLEIEVKPAKPIWIEPKYLDELKGKIEIETKYDGIRVIILKDEGKYQAFSSHGNPFGGNFKNIYKELKPALDQGWVFSGEVLDAAEPDSRGAAASVAKNPKYTPDRILFIVWNAFKITPEMKKKGVITPGEGEGLPEYRKMRGDLIRWMRKLRPKQVKLAKRWKIGTYMPSEILKKVIKRGEEGIVAKLKSGKLMYKYKELSPERVAPVVSFNLSKSAGLKGQVTSITAKTPYGKVFTIGGGYTWPEIEKLTKIYHERKGNVKGLFVGYRSYKPTKPLEKGGSPSHAQFVSLRDEHGKKLVVKK